MDRGRPVLKVAAVFPKKFENGTVKIVGILGDILDNLAQYLEFSIEVVRPPDRQWGLLTANGTWNGMIGMLNRSEADLSVGPFSMNPERNAAVHLTYPIIYDYETILLAPRPKVENDIGGFLKAFPLSVWLLLLGSLLAISMILMGSEFISGTMKGIRRKDIFAQSVMFSLKAITAEGSSWMPYLEGGRALMGTWLLASTILIAAYSGVLVAMLTLPKLIIPIDSLEDLVHQTKIPWRISVNTHFTRLLENSKSGLFHLAFVGSSGYIGSQDGADPDFRKNVAEGKYAAFFPRLMAVEIMKEDYIRTGICRMYLTRERLNFDMLTFAVRRGSPYDPKVNRLILALHESGIHSQIMKKNYPLDVKCLQSPKLDRGDGIAPLNIQSLGGPLLLFVGGLAMSSLIILAEIVSKTRPFCS